MVTGFLLLVVVFQLAVVSSSSNEDIQLHHRTPAVYPEPDDAVVRSAEAYISWGSSGGKTTPDCDNFLSVFAGNQTWVTPFTADSFFSWEVTKACQQLTLNVSWHTASLEAGHYLYPLYTPKLSGLLWKIGFVWTAVGVANEWREILNMKQYDVKVISALSLQIHPNNISYISIATDYFWPEAGSTFPSTLKEIVDGYVSFLGRDCKMWASKLFWMDYGMLIVSGDDTIYQGPTQLTEYCSKMMYMWSSYVTNVHDMTYSVNTYVKVVSHVAFTWTRTGLYQGRVKTDQVLTIIDVQTDNGPTADLKIGTATDYFQPQMAG